jgi:hypothetical protein
LTRALSSSANAFAFEQRTDYAAEAAEARLKREALGEIERMRRIDEWIPSYRNVHTRAALRGLVDLMQLRIIPKRTTSFLPYTRPGNHDEVRLEAFDHLINLGMMANDAFIRYIFSSLASEPSAYFRDRLWRRIHKGLASIALGETKFEKRQDRDVEMNGLTIDTGESLVSRNEAMERSTVEGALNWMRKQLEENKALEGAIMDALRYVFVLTRNVLLLTRSADRLPLVSKISSSCLTSALTYTTQSTISQSRCTIRGIGASRTLAKARFASPKQRSSVSSRTPHYQILSARRAPNSVRAHRMRSAENLLRPSR